MGEGSVVILWGRPQDTVDCMHPAVAYGKAGQNQNLIAVEVIELDLQIADMSCNSVNDAHGQH